MLGLLRRCSALFGHGVEEFPSQTVIAQLPGNEIREINDKNHSSLTK